MISQRALQGGTALFVAAVGVILAAGAARLPAEKGYSILGPQVFPFAVATLLIVLAVVLAIQASRASAKQPSDAESQPTSARAGAAWLTAGLVAVAALINVVGFVLASALLFTMAARGFGSKSPLRDLAIGISLVLPVYWLFTAGLGVSLPPLINAWI